MSEIINAGSPHIAVEDCLLEFPELQYDRLKLVEIFEQVKPYARGKGLPWREFPNPPIPTDQLTGVVIQNNDHMIMNPAELGKGVDLLDFEYIRELVAPFNFSHKIASGHIDIIWNRPGFIFYPHVDHYAKSTMMWPIIPEDAANPVDFYHRPGTVFEESKEYKDMREDEIIYTHYYSTKHPAIFNSHVIHGVRTVNTHRVYLRLRANQDFISVRDDYRAGKLIKL